MSDLADFRRRVHEPLEISYAAAVGERDRYRDRCTSLAARVETLENALRAGDNYLRKLGDPMCPPAIRQVALDEFADQIRAVLASHQAGEETQG